MRKDTTTDGLLRKWRARASGDRVVELVGVEPTTRVLWNAGGHRGPACHNKVRSQAEQLRRERSCPIWHHRRSNEGAIRALRPTVQPKRSTRADWSDKVSWSDTPAFHNTLVVGSSPTSSTTHSRAPEISTFHFCGKCPSRRQAGR